MVTGARQIFPASSAAASNLRLQPTRPASWPGGRAADPLGRDHTPMRHRALVLCVIIAVAVGCRVETLEPGEVHRVISESDLLAIRVGTPSTEVEKSMGKPLSIVPGAEEQWHYTVLRGEAPTLISFLFRRNRKIELAEGVVSFTSGKVIRIRIEPPTSKPTPSQTR